MEKDEHIPTIESLLLDMIANQQSLHNEIVGLYERIDRLEETITEEQTVREEQSREDLVESLLEPATAAVIQAGKASTSWLQRKFRIGYSVAAALMDRLEEEEIVGPQDGAKPREVLVDENYNSADQFFESAEKGYEDDGEKDDLYEAVKAFVVEQGKASTSHIQRKFRIGYSRAAGLMDILEVNEVIGPQVGSKARKVLVKSDTE